MRSPELQKKAEAEAEAGRIALEKANAEATDWRVKCRKCGAALTGTLAQLQVHRC